MQKNRAGSAEQHVAEQVDIVEEKVASIVRSTYSRARTAADTGADRRDVVGLLGYFEAFAHDLLNLD